MGSTKDLPDFGLEHVLLMLAAIFNFFLDPAHNAANYGKKLGSFCIRAMN